MWTLLATDKSIISPPPGENGLHAQVQPLSMLQCPWVKIICNYFTCIFFSHKYLYSELCYSVCAVPFSALRADSDAHEPSPLPRHTRQSVHSMWIKQYRQKCKNLIDYFYAFHFARKFTIFPRSLEPFYLVSYYIKWLATSWTYSRRINGNGNV